jgi:hypothetical protein
MSSVWLQKLQVKLRILALKAFHATVDVHLCNERGWDVLEHFRVEEFEVSVLSTVLPLIVLTIGGYLGGYLNPRI